MRKQVKKSNKTMWILILALLAMGVFFNKSPKLLKNFKQPTDTLVSQKRLPPPPNTFYSFVPYWSASNFSNSLPDNSEKGSFAHSLIYFGLKPKSNGTIDTDEPGYVALDTFASSAQDYPSTQKYLTLRMLSSEINFDILDNPTKQNILIEEFVSVASRKNFDGVVLDLEVSGFPTEKLKRNITSFSSHFAAVARQNNLLSGQLIYGDVFYRLRPYDVAALAESHDLLFFMMYDFHKAAGSPGPNFPAGGTDEYGYSFSTFLEQLGQAMILPEKSVFLFGMYGYNWSVDERQRPLKPATAQRLKDITTQFASCAGTCKKTRDPLSGETTIQYTSGETDHIVWYEDGQSVTKKIDLARASGMYQFGFWTYGYW